jgi:hypothetical protein
MSLIVNRALWVPSPDGMAKRVLHARAALSTLLPASRVPSTARIVLALPLPTPKLDLPDVSDVKPLRYIVAHEMLLNEMV